MRYVFAHGMLRRTRTPPLQQLDKEKAGEQTIESSEAEINLPLRAKTSLRKADAPQSTKLSYDLVCAIEH